MQPKSVLLILRRRKCIAIWSTAMIGLTLVAVARGQTVAAATKENPTIAAAEAALKRGDFRTALSQLTPLANQGNANAQIDLANMYHRGQGVPQDDKGAVRLYRLAADQGLAGAQNNLGKMYALGQGVSQDYKEAVQLQRLAAEQGLAGAQADLGEMYHLGQGVPQDDKEAARLFRLAAVQSDHVGQYYLGVAYANGQGVPSRDYVQAYIWFKAAADSDISAVSAAAVKGRDFVASKLTPEIIAQITASPVTPPTDTRPPARSSPARADQMVAHLADLSALLQESSFFLIGEDGSIINRTLKIGVDRTTGTEAVDTDEGEPSLAAVMGTRYQFMAASLGRIDLDAGSAGSSEHTVFQNGADGQMHATSQPEKRRTVTIRFLAGVDVTVRDPARGTRNYKTKVLTLNTLNCTDDRLQQLQAVVAEINGLINGQTSSGGSSPSVPAADPSNVVKGYLAAASSLQSVATAPFLSKGFKGDLVTEFVGNKQSNWSFSDADTKIDRPVIAASGIAATVQAMVVFKGGGTFMGRQTTFSLIMEDGRWKISKIDPPAKAGGPGVTPL